MRGSGRFADGGAMAGGFAVAWGFALIGDFAVTGADDLLPLTFSIAQIATTKNKPKAKMKA